MATNQKKSGGMGIPKCPHCGHSVNPIHAWGIKGKGEYACPECGGYSEIHLSKALYIMGIASVILAGILLLIFIFTGCMGVALLPLMLAPFFVFTVLSPFLIYLRKFEIDPKKIKQKKKKAPAQAKKPAGSR